MITATYFFYGCKKIDTAEPGNSNASASSKSDAVTTKPNIVFIVGDDIGYEIPTCNGGQSYSTPNIDLLAKNGMRFQQCYGSADCSPARFMLLTGKYNFRNYTEWGVMDRSQQTIGNMLKSAGYATCYVGKWQLDGGDASIRAFGFDKYNVWLPYKRVPEEADGSRYKSALLYQSGAFLPSSQTLNKYSVDIFTNYALNFIDVNKAKPFFLYYANPLAHKKFTPTPDDPEYATWDFINRSSKKFFPNMVSYMDKQLQILNDKIQSLGLQNNTVFIFVGDNGSPKGISSQFKGITIPGEKGQTTTYGTRVPLILSWPGHIAASSVTNQLVSFTDFMPTLANIAGISVPPGFGIIDGQTFYPVLTGSASSSRDYIFNHFQPFISEHSRLKRYVQNATYKLYDKGGFYNIALDVEEQSPIPTDQLTPQQVTIRNYFIQILSQMH